MTMTQFNPMTGKTTLEELADDLIENRFEIRYNDDELKIIFTSDTMLNVEDGKHTCPYSFIFQEVQFNCGFHSSSLTAFKKHYNTHFVRSSKSFPYQCKCCRASFKCNIAMNQHVHDCHKQLLDLINEDKEEVDDKQPFTAPNTPENQSRSDFYVSLLSNFKIVDIFAAPSKPKRNFSSFHDSDEDTRELIKRARSMHEQIMSEIVV
jgi:hypothetical protein